MFVRKPSNSLYLNTYIQVTYPLSSLYILFLIMSQVYYIADMLVYIVSDYEANLKYF